MSWPLRTRVEQTLARSALRASNNKHDEMERGVGIRAIP